MDRGVWRATEHVDARIGHDLVAKPPPPAHSIPPLRTLVKVHPSLVFDGTEHHDLSFRNVEFQVSFFTSFTFIKNLFSSSSLSAIRVVSSAYLRLLIFFPQSFFLVLSVYCYQPISVHPHAWVLSHVIPWTAACQAPLSMDFSRQEYWSGLPFPSPAFPILKTGKLSVKVC